MSSLTNFSPPIITSSAPDAFLATNSLQRANKESPNDFSIRIPPSGASNNEDEITPRLLKCIEFINSALNEAIDSTPRNLTYPAEESTANAAASRAFNSTVNPPQPAMPQRTTLSAAELAAQSSYTKDVYLVQDTLEVNLDLFCKALNDLSSCNGENYDTLFRRLSLYKIKLIDKIEEQKIAAANCPEKEELLSKFDVSISRIEAAYNEVTKGLKRVI